jgi:hypothetical protein
MAKLIKDGTGALKLIKDGTREELLTILGPPQPPMTSMWPLSSVICEWP